MPLLRPPLAIRVVPLDLHLLSRALVVLAVAAPKLLPAMQVAPLRVCPPGLLFPALAVLVVAAPNLLPTCGRRRCACARRVSSPPRRWC